jgi:hypothetical protein
MDYQKQSPALALTSKSGLGTAFDKANNTKRPLKWKRVLTALTDGRSFNRFEAERQLSDHCLHSTVSELQDKGVTILRRDETVPGFQGIPTHVTRYWLADTSRLRALELLGRITEAREAA